MVFVKRATQIILTGFCVLVIASLAVAQQSAQPVVRLGNWVEVGNEVYMHVLASADIRYRTVHNREFEGRIRDRTNGRAPGDSSNHEGNADLSYAELRLGAEFRYQKNLHMQVLFEHQSVFDGNLIDDRSNTSNPGGTDVFGRAASTENPGFHIERYWIDYKFAGTPLRMRVGADLWRVDQAGLVGDDDPRFAVFADFGDFDLMAAAVIEFESQRIGLTNDNDFIYYTFSGGYNLKPHRFQLDVMYFRDRFNGADTQTGAIAFRGQKVDGVSIMGSWKGKLGPMNGLVQGMVSTGTARGGSGVGLPAGITPQKDYDILGFGAVAFAEVDLGIVRPFVGAVFATGDGDPNDNKLHGFHPMAMPSSGGAIGELFPGMEASSGFRRRDYACPALMTSAAARAGGRATAIGNNVFSGVDQCGHTVDQPYNDRIGQRSHPGLVSVYSNPGTLAIPVGLRVFPVKGHEISGWYLYKQWLSSRLLETAYNLPNGSIDKTQFHELGAYWLWTLNPYFDIRVAGQLAFAGDAYRDLARLADCNPTLAGTQPCKGDDVALSAEARFRARF